MRGSILLFAISAFVLAAHADEPAGPGGELTHFLDEAFRDAQEIRDTFFEQVGVRAKDVEFKLRPFTKVSRMHGSSEFIRTFSRLTQGQLGFLRILKSKFKLPKSEMRGLPQSIPSPIKPPGQIRAQAGMRLRVNGLDTCPYPPNDENNQCDRQAQYRSADGICNNLKRPLWGSTNRALSRFLPPDYADGISEPREARNNKPLPGAREVSVAMCEEKDNPSPVHTMFYTDVGQFLDHDVTATAISKIVTSDGEIKNVMCGDSGCETDGPENEACFPIKIPVNDPDFKNEECLMFVRSEPVLNDDCGLGPAQQLNQITSFVDASNVYGSTQDHLNSLRNTSDPGRGTLKVSANLDPAYKPLLPRKSSSGCPVMHNVETFDAETPCFFAGDGRANEQVGLTTIHSVFHRHHNYLEGQLKSLNPQWDGDKLFQEARKILIAQWQHITYNEYVPVTVGPDAVKKYGLALESSGYWNGYDSKQSPDVSNVFATAAFRFGHSMVQGELNLRDQMYKKSEDTYLSEVYFRSTELYNNARPGGSGVDSILLGLVSSPAQLGDRFFDKQVSVSLFNADPPMGLGTDIAAINVQRGRDHGLPGYNDWRARCGLAVANTFSDFASDFDADVVAKLQNLYTNPDDIDLFVGALSERVVEGGTVGPTFACLIAEQFRNLRAGDRFWYESPGQNVGFTPDQLKEIRKTTMAKILCTNMDSVAQIQKYVMLQPSSKALTLVGSSSPADLSKLASLYKDEDNEIRPCSDLDDVDLSPWAVGQ